ncbi:hypothetical protein [Cryobacterium sp. HLT2-28]|uniref:hypothetical protein n=1 Tax=Cryobacterium sp. HLT2-28 TaxID=1259146 RepID=UPI00106BFE6E|nr:hypothetical protein [Cryobacterium sp. HLT2-28]TFB91374.1 hypothetical protein E3O48_15145 [Cryobacterium sp. HLT2-28]
MPGIPTTRVAVRGVWEGDTPDYGNVVDAENAGRLLTDLVRSALELLEYRRLAWEPDAIQLVSSDRAAYLRFPAADERTADVAVQLSQALSAHAADGLNLGRIMGANPPWRSVRILVLADEDGAATTRLDLDPEGECRVSWYGPFDNARFSEIATGFALFLTHIVANVFDDDDGSETFEESFDWVV